MNETELEILLTAVDDVSGTMEEIAANVATSTDSIQGSFEGVASAATTDFNSAQNSYASLASMMAEDTSEITGALAAAVGSMDETSLAFISGTNSMKDDMNGVGASSTLMSGAAGGGLLLISNYLGQASSSVDSFIEKAYSATGQWNISVEALNQVLKDTKSSIPASELLAYTQTMQNTTLFQQQQTLSAAEQVMAYKDLQPNYQTIIGLSADLATKVGVLTNTAPNLANATKLMTDALENPVSAMSRLITAGVAIPPLLQTQIQAMAKVGNTSGAQALLIDVMKNSIGGLAVQADQASGTGFQKLANTITSFMQQNNALTTDLDALASKLNDVIKVVINWSEEHPNLTAVILIGTAAVLGIAAALTAGAAVFLILSAAVETLVGIALIPFIATVVVIGAAMAAAFAIGFLLGDMIYYIGAAVISWVGSMVPAFKAGFEDALNYVEGLFTSWYNTIMKYVNDIINAIKSIAGGIGGAISGAVGGVASIGAKLFAEGGIVTQPTLGIIGEAGPEAVIPLSAFNGGNSLGGSGTGGGNSGSGNIVINLQGTFMTDNQTATKWANVIAKQIGNNNKLRTI